MTEHHEGAVIPVEDQTVSEFVVMPVGIHRTKITKIEEGLNKNDEPIVDGRGYPCKRITFIERGKKEINSLFFYHNIATDHPDRQADDKKCKSAFILGNLRNALKLESNQRLTLEEAKARYLWIMVIRNDYFDPNDKSVIVKQYNEVNGLIFWPDSKIKPDVFGDPANNDGKPAGDFIKRSKAREYMLEGNSSAPAATEPEETKTDTIEDSDEDF